jgi:hypothetical protein
MNARKLLIALGVLGTALVLAATPVRRAIAAAGDKIVDVVVDVSQSSSPSSTFGGAAKGAVVTVNAYEGRQPFFLHLTMAQNGCGNCAQGTATLSLGGKRLVLEYVSAQVLADHPVTSLTLANIAGTTFQGLAYLAPVDLGPALNGTSQVFAANQQLKMYADDGNSIVASTGLSSVLGTVTSGFLELHGYLIDP